MTVPESKAPILHTLKPREVLLYPDERQQLTDTTRDFVQEAFLYNDFTETIATSSPLELHADPAHAPNATFRSIMPRAYNMAHIEAVVDHEDNETHLREAKLLLFLKGVPMKYHSELIISADDLDYEGGIDVDNPQLYIRTPSLKLGEKDSVTYLDYEALMDVLDGLIEQANPDKVVPKDLMIMEKLFALLDESPELSVDRRTKYMFSHPAQVGHVVVSIYDGYTSQPGNVPVHSSHSVDVEKSQPLSFPDQAVTQYTLSDEQGNVESSFSINYVQYGDNGNEPDHFEQLIHAETTELNDLEISYPSKFGSSVMASLEMLLRTPEGYDKEHIDHEFFEV